MVKAVFVSATSTDVGKTYVSSLIVSKMKEFGLKCGYFKPVLSGVEIVEGKSFIGDCEQVIKHAKLEENAIDLVSYSFKEPVSPHLASRIENIEILPEKICRDFELLSQKYDYIVVEGAGGIVCPIVSDENRVFMQTDLIKMLDLGVVIVAEPALGSINSCVLTFEHAKLKNICVEGFIYNKFVKNNFMYNDNVEQISKFTGVESLACVELNQSSLDIEKNVLIKLFKEIDFGK